MLKNISISLMCVALTACGASSSNTSRSNYIPMGRGMAGLTAKVQQSSIRIAVVNAQLDQKDNVSKVVLAWIDAMRPVAGKPLATQVVFVNQGEASDATYIFSSGDWPHTDLGDHPTVTMSSATGTQLFNVTLHEFGHAFGLGDTYVNGTSGMCMQGQPQAVMCNTSFTTLQKDDIAGVQAIYKQVFPGEVPMPTNSQTQQIFGGVVSQSGNAGTSAIVLSYTGTVAPNGRMQFCVGGAQECSAPNAVWYNAASLGAKNNVSFFTAINGVTGSSLLASDGLKVTARYLPADGVNPSSSTTMLFRSHP